MDNGFKFPIRKISTPLDADFHKGGSGSGNFGHSGRPGERGGSGSGDMIPAPTTRSGRHITNVDSNPWRADANTFGTAKVREAIRNLAVGQSLVFEFPHLQGSPKIIIGRNEKEYTGSYSIGNGKPKEFSSGDTATESGIGHIASLARNHLIGS
jgi:hypothetical protein